MSAAVHAAARTRAVYLRLGPEGGNRSRAPLDFAFGRAITVRDGDALTIVANGLWWHRRRRRGICRRRGSMPEWLDMHTGSHRCRAIARASRRRERRSSRRSIFTTRLEASSPPRSPRRPGTIEFVDLADRYAESGKPDDLLRKYA